MKLEKIHTITGKIKLATGLHIGGSKENIEIGGMDQPIIKHPHTGAPYVPGSSIKGKMRSLLEVSFFAAQVADGKPCGCGKCDICRIFGTANDNKPEELGPTRIICRDANLSREYQAKYNNGELPMEEKHENTIDRIKGTAMHPRPLERVPAGVEFNFSISFKKMEKDSSELINWIWKGLRLIELDGLGGSVSRGSGQVEFVELKFDDGESIDLKAKEIWSKQ